MRIYLLSCLLGAGLSQAQTLEAFVEASASGNVDVGLSRNAEARASTDSAQTWSGLLPALSVNAGYVHNQYAAVVTIPTGVGTSDKITITPNDQLDATLKVEVPLVDASRWLRVASAESNAAAARQRTEQSKDQVDRQIVTAFYALAGAEAVLESAQRSFKVAQAQLEQAQSRFKAGVANELELVRAEAEVQRCRQVTDDADALVLNNRTSLQLLTGLEVKKLQVPAADDLRPAPELATLVSGVDQLPELKAAQADVNTQKQNHAAAGLALVPTVSAQFTQRFTNATGFQGQNALWNAGVNLNWRLDVAGLHAIRGASLVEQAAALNAQKARQQAAQRLEQDWRRVTTSIAKVSSAQAQFKAAERGSSLAHQRYEAGVASQLDAISADRDLFAAEVNNISAGFELAAARAALQLSAGRALKVNP